MSGLPIPKQTLPPSINVMPQSFVTPPTSASMRLLPLYHCAPLAAVIDVLNQNPTVKSFCMAVTNETGNVPEETPEVNDNAAFECPKRSVVFVVEVRIPL